MIFLKARKRPKKSILVFLEIRREKTPKPFWLSVRIKPRSIPANLQSKNPFRQAWLGNKQPQPLHVKLKLSSFVVWAAHHSDTDDRKLLFDSVSNYGGCSFWVSAPRTMWSVFVKNQELVGVYTDRFQAISQNVIIENPYFQKVTCT